MVHPQPPLGQAPPTPVTEAPPSITACRFCGCVPAVETTFRGHQGFLVVMRFLSVPGPFCRDCGLATFRTMTSRTLVQGWYGYGSLIITPIMSVEFPNWWNAFASRSTDRRARRYLNGP